MARDYLEGLQKSLRSKALGVDRIVENERPTDTMA